jgi:hypothetical protein
VKMALGKLSPCRGSGCKGRGEGGSARGMMERQRCQHREWNRGSGRVRRGKAIYIVGLFSRPQPNNSDPIYS